MLPYPSPIKNKMNDYKHREDGTVVFVNFNDCIKQARMGNKKASEKNHPGQNLGDC